MCLLCASYQRMYNIDLYYRYCLPWLFCLGVVARIFTVNLKFSLWDLCIIYTLDNYNIYICTIQRIELRDSALSHTPSCFKTKKFFETGLSKLLRPASQCWEYRHHHQVQLDYCIFLGKRSEFASVLFLLKHLTANFRNFWWILPMIYIIDLLVIFFLISSTFLNRILLWVVPVLYYIYLCCYYFNYLFMYICISMD